MYHCLAPVSRPRPQPLTEKSPAAGHPTPCRGQPPTNPPATARHGTNILTSAGAAPCHDLKSQEFKPACEDGHCHPTPTPNVTPAENQPTFWASFYSFFRAFHTIPSITRHSSPVRIHRAFCFSNSLDKRKARTRRQVSHIQFNQPNRSDCFAVILASLFPVQELAANAPLHLGNCSTEQKHPAPWRQARETFSTNRANPLPLVRKLGEASEERRGTAQQRPRTQPGPHTLRSFPQMESQHTQESG